MRYTVRHHTDEFGCPTCGAPVYPGDTAWQDGPDGPVFCSASCAGTDPRTNDLPPRPTFYVTDDAGYAAEVDRNGPDAGKPAGHPDRPGAIRAARRLMRDAGEAAVVTTRPPVRPADAPAACGGCGQARCRCEEGP